MLCTSSEVTRHIAASIHPVWAMLVEHLPVGATQRLLSGENVTGPDLAHDPGTSGPSPALHPVSWIPGTHGPRPGERRRHGRPRSSW
jgi:hypothetical protein